MEHIQLLVIDDDMNTLEGPYCLHLQSEDGGTMVL